VHRSRLCGFIIDCEVVDLEAAAAFWSGALGRDAVAAPDDPRASRYVALAMRPEEPVVEVQRVDHASRVHLDIEADDVEAEVRRLEALGARRVARVRDWCVMEAPTGQRFCVVERQHDDFARTANVWDSAPAGEGRARGWEAMPPGRADAVSAGPAAAMAEAVRAACIDAALRGYEEASLSGLCGEGALECAVSAMRTLALEPVLREAAERSG